MIHPGLCKVLELGIDRLNQAQLLRAPPAFELFFLAMAVDVSIAFKNEADALQPSFA